MVQAGQVQSGQVQSGQVQSGQVQSGQVKPSQVKSSQVKSSHAKRSQVKSSQVKSSQVKSSQVKSSQVKSSLVKSSQVKPSQVKSSQAKSSQVKSSLMCCFRIGNFRAEKEIQAKRTDLNLGASYAIVSKFSTRIPVFMSPLGRVSYCPNVIFKTDNRTNSLSWNKIRSFILHILFCFASKFGGRK